MNQLLKYFLILFGASMLFVLLTYWWIKGASGGDIFFVLINAVFQVIASVVFLIAVPKDRGWLVVIAPFVNGAVVFGVVKLLGWMG
jgi:hypothetical protein